MTAPVLLGADGRPQPPQDIAKRLRGIEPRLGLRFVPGAYEVWAITLEWPEHDPRRQGVKENRVDPDSTYDIVGWLPAGCALDEAPAFVSNSLRTFPRADVQSLVSRMERWNEEKAGGREETSDVLAELTDNKFGMEERRVTGRRTRHQKPTG